MIPRAIAKIFDTTERLKEQGWAYELEGQFLEIVRGTPLPALWLIIR